MTALQRLFRFHGGVKPAYNKQASTGLPIAVAPTSELLVIPLHQSIGGMPRPLVTAHVVLALRLTDGGEFHLVARRISRSANSPSTASARSAGR